MDPRIRLHWKENPIYVFLFWELCSLSPNSYSCICERVIYYQDWSTYFPAAEQADRSWKYIILSQIYECWNRETEHNNSVLEITVAFLGIHQREPDIYIGFSPALHLQCGIPYSYRQDVWLEAQNQVTALKN